MMLPPINPAMLFAVPLLAAGLDWLEALLPVLFIGFWVLSQIIAVVKKVAGPADRPQAAPPPVRRAGPVVVERNIGDLQDEIREFLRREMPEDRSTATKPPPPRPPKPQETGRSKLMPQASAPPVSGSSIAAKVKHDFAKELEHLSSPLTADRSLVSPQSPGVAAAASPAAEIAKSLRSPATLRQLIVVREILERPVDRW